MSSGSDLGNTHTERRWKIALERLRIKDPDLAQALIPPRVSPPASQQDVAIVQHVEDVLQAKLTTHKLNEWVIRVGRREYALQEYGKKLVGFVLWSKDIIAEGCAASPYTSLAWSGIAMILPLFLKSSEQNDVMLAGLSKITDILQLYTIRAALYPVDGTGKWKDFDAAILDLYTKVLEYQAQVVRHLSHSSLHRAASSIKGTFDWNGWTQQIEDVEGQCLKFSDLFDKEEERRVLKRQETLLQEFVANSETLQAVLASSVQQAADIKMDRDEMELLHSLVDGQPYEQEKNTRRKPVEGTCQWVVDLDDFEQWRRTNHSSLLWLSAGPGCGKSVLCRFLVDREHLRQPYAVNSHVYYFFFRDGQQNFSEGASAIRAILHQIFSTHPARKHLISLASQHFRSQGAALRRNLASLWKILMAVVDDPRSGTIVCAIDALDECTAERGQLIEHITSYYQTQTRKNHSRLKFLITSRRYDTIEDQFSAMRMVGKMIEIDANKYVEQIEADIEKVLVHDVETYFGGGKNTKVQSVLKDYLRAIPNKTYLWLYLVLDYLKRTCKGAKSKQIQEALKKAPETVEIAYENILNTHSENKVLARSILMLVVAAQRPLRTEELNVALALSFLDSIEEVNDVDDIELYEEQKTRSAIENACGQLVQVFDDKVYLLHQTLQTFLVGSIVPAHGPEMLWRGVFSLNDAHEFIWKTANRCIYLTQPRFAFCTFVCHPYIDYVETFWPAHYRQMETQTQKSHVIECERVLLQFVLHFNPRHILPLLGDCVKAATEAQLVSAASFNLECLIEHLLAAGMDVNFANENGRTALYEAVYRNNVKLLRMLCDKGADPDIGDKYWNIYHQPLHYACIYGYEEIVETLLSRGSKIINSTLADACDQDSVIIPRLLIDHGADVNGPGDPLAKACKRGHEYFVRLLIDSGADVNGPGAPLERACYNGNENNVRLLMDGGADVNGPGESLAVACRRGNQNIVRWLIDGGADVNGPGQPLAAACRRGNQNIVQWLIDGGADVNGPGQPLANAVRKGNENIVRMLIDRGADVNGPDEPLAEACYKGKEEIVRLLLDAGANVNGLDGGIGDHGIQTYKVREDPDPWLRDMIRVYTTLPLIAACRRGHEDIARLLMDRGANPNNDDGPALIFACEGGHEKVVKLLLDRGADVNAGRGEALRGAQEGGHDHVVRLLYERGHKVNDA